MPLRILLLCLFLTACGAATEVTTAPAVTLSDPLPPMRTFGAMQVNAPKRSNVEMTQDFLDLSFLMESGAKIERMSRFEQPVTVAMRGPVPPTASADLDAVLRRIRSEARIDIRRTTDAAGVTIEFVPTAVLRKLVPAAACFVVPRVSSFEEYGRKLSSPDTDWTTLATRERTAIFVPSDTSPQEIRDCLHEELAQAIGPLNDLYRLPDSVFNDDNFHNILTGFDMLMLRVYYAPEMRSGMTREEAAVVVPRLLARYNPSGEKPAAMVQYDTPRAWIRQIETAFGPDTRESRRVAAARRAVEIAQAQGWQDARAGFAWFGLARLSTSSDVATALTGFINAARVFRNLPDGEIHAAHVDMQMAAFALSAGQPEAAVMLADVAIPPVRRGQNAALLATLLMIRSEALAMMGEDEAARQARVDSLGWARYGFGTEDEVRRNMAEVLALAPRLGG